MKSVREILMDGLAIPSVSSMSNPPVVKCALKYLASEYLRIHTSATRDASGTDNVNLVALTRNAKGKTAELALVYHVEQFEY